MKPANCEELQTEIREAASRLNIALSKARHLGEPLDLMIERCPSTGTGRIHVALRHPNVREVAESARA